MDLSALIDEFRNQSGDHGVPAFWPDPTVTAFLNRAEHEAAERAKLLPDKTTASVVNVPLVIGQTDYLLHPSIFDVVGVWLSRGGTDPRRWLVCRSLEGDISYDQQHRPTQAGWAREFESIGDEPAVGFPVGDLTEQTIEVGDIKTLEPKMVADGAGDIERA